MMTPKSLSLLGLSRTLGSSTNLEKKVTIGWQTQPLLFGLSHSFIFYTEQFSIFIQSHSMVHNSILNNNRKSHAFDSFQILICIPLECTVLGIYKLHHKYQLK